MKTGNSIMAVFFFYMAFRIPVEISNLSLAYDIPDELFYKFISLVLFGVCIMLGVVSLEYGRESKKIMNVKTSNSKIKEGKIPEGKKITDLPDSLKNSISNVDKDITVTGNRVVTNTVSKVDKNLPIIKVVDEKDPFDKISNNINDVIGSK